MFKTNLINRASYNHNRGNIEQIKNANFYLTESKLTNRIFHNYSNLKKELRNFISHESNEKLIEIDITNSQPFFLACLLSELEQTADIKMLIDITVSGQFYEYFRNAFNISESISRDVLKKQILTMFYCPSYYEIKHLYTFKNLFPNVYKAIQMIKADDYKAFAISLQRAESDLLIKTVASILIEKNIDFIPIHDSFIVQEKNRDTVIDIINSECEKKYKLVPMLKVK
jgi:hypothetical protein